MDFSAVNLDALAAAIIGFLFGVAVCAYVYEKTGDKKP